MLLRRFRSNLFQRSHCTSRTVKELLGICKQYLSVYNLTWAVTEPWTSELLRETAAVSSRSRRGVVCLTRRTVCGRKTGDGVADSCGTLEEGSCVARFLELRLIDFISMKKGSLWYNFSIKCIILVKKTDCSYFFLVSSTYFPTLFITVYIIF